RNTVAPRSASSIAHIGPGPMPVSSTILMPANGPIGPSAFSEFEPAWYSTVGQAGSHFEEAQEMSGPLAGIRVIDLTSGLLSPGATQILGDMGADVIKVEPPQGDPIRALGPSRHPGMGAYFLNINRSKKNVALDLKRPAPRAALRKLVETADVFAHNM